LPVEFTFFSIACADNAAIINWQTATEINTDHFEIQRSLNNANWTTIANQLAAGHCRITAIPTAHKFLLAKYFIASFQWIKVDGKNILKLKVLHVAAQKTGR